MRPIITHIAHIFLLLALWHLSACGPKKICPAYQSAFYLNQEVADEDFSYFGPDSMPKIENVVKKTDVLLIVKIGKKKREKLMATIPMITIFPETADSLLAQNDVDEAIDEAEPEEATENAEPEYDDQGNLIPKRRKTELAPDDPEISDPTIEEIPDDDVEDLTSSEEAKRVKKNLNKKQSKKKDKKDSKKADRKQQNDDAITPKEEEEPTENDEEKDQF